MSHTLELILDRRWRLRVTWSPRRLFRPGYVEDFIVDSDNDLKSQLLALTTDPWVLGIRCERYFGSQPAHPAAASTWFPHLTSETEPAPNTPAPGQAPASCR